MLRNVSLYVVGHKVTFELCNGQSVGDGSIFETGVARCDFNTADIAQKRKTSRPACNQMICRKPARSNIVGSNRAMYLAHLMLSPGDKRMITRCNTFDRNELIRLSDQENAVEQAGIDDPDKPVVSLGNDPRKNEIIAAFGDDIGKLCKHCHEEWV